MDRARRRALEKIAAATAGTYPQTCAHVTEHPAATAVALAETRTQ